MEEFLDLIKQFAKRRLTQSGQVSTTPAFLVSAHLVADSGGTATAAIYDSQGANGDPEVDLSAPSSGVDPRVFIPPLYFNKGIYLSCGSHVTSVLLHYRNTGDIAKLAAARSLKSYLPSWLQWPARGPKST